jgi:hypothetical protein
MMGDMQIGIIGALVLALDIYAIYCILMEKSSGTRKVLWIVGVIVFPLVGMIVYFLFFRRAAAEQKRLR